MKTSRIFSFITSLVLTAAMLSSCEKAKQPKELFEEQQSGVCMVLNSFYYKIELPIGLTLYCSGIDEDGDLDKLTPSEDEIQEFKTMITGTAFFIDEDGTLMTNRHVVSPYIEDDVIKIATSRFISQIKEYMQYWQLELAEEYEELESKKQDCYTIDYWGEYTVDWDEYNKIEAAQKELESDFNYAMNAVKGLDGMDLSQIKVTPISEIGIAYNNTYVTSEDDFLGKNPCVATRISKDEDVDLALIQLKNKKTPSGKYIFKIKGRDIIPKSYGEKIASLFGSEKDDKIDVDKELIMIGFNAGMVLGNTRQGIQAQMTTGKVSQKPDGTKILYSIPTVQGSSGSPVIDTEGYVRAVNFAKLGGTDSFNFGIPENLILEFLNE